jgi:GNAT superfamily N-acetyltransferase
MTDGRCLYGIGQLRARSDIAMFDLTGLGLQDLTVARLIIVTEDDFVVVGTVMCFAHGTEYASLGMMIVSPQRQGQGIGRELVPRVLKEFGERTVLLHGAQEEVPLCESLGFTQIGTVHSGELIIGGGH